VPTAALQRSDGRTAGDAPPLVLHVIFRLAVGGLENGVVNLINHMPPDAYRHAIVSLTDVTDFRQRLRDPQVPVIALNKAPGHGVWLYPRLFRLFRRLQPAVVHTRNLAALEATVPAWLAGVPVRVHGEHGREGIDLAGARSPYHRVRRLYRPFVTHYVALSADLATYLRDGVGVPARRLSQLYNGVDSDRFAPAADGPGPIEGCPFSPARHWILGTVGRMAAVKDQVTLARAFALALRQRPALRERLRLVLVGDGPLRPQVEQALVEGGCLEVAWLPGERADVPEVMRGMHLFALPSISEGISNVILEAMSCGLPVLATAVGGNTELLSAGRTGVLVPPADPAAMAAALLALALDPERAAAMGRAGRADAEARFSMRAMVGGYRGLYDRLLGAATTG
jgi:sugar transferase (PEP-CTERM/EpsH1 system associated)